MSVIEFTVPAVPVAQPRARAVSFNGHARVYEDRKHPVAAFKASVRMAFAAAYSGSPLTDPLRCDLTFVMPRPKSLIWKTRPMPRLPHDKKSDLDNLMKSTWDALNGIAFHDDGQICQGEIQKWIASGDEQPHVTVRIETLEF